MAAIYYAQISNSKRERKNSSSLIKDFDVIDEKFSE